MQPTTTIQQVPAMGWKAWVTDRGAVVLDVREPQEWAATGVLEASMLIPLGELPSRLGELDPARPVLTVCRSGNRSLVAAEFLARNGFAEPANLAGGVVAVAASS